MYVPKRHQINKTPNDPGKITEQWSLKDGEKGSKLESRYAHVGLNVFFIYLSENDLDLPRSYLFKRTEDQKRRLYYSYDSSPMDAENHRQPRKTMQVIFSFSGDANNPSRSCERQRIHAVLPSVLEEYIGIVPIGGGQLPFLQGNALDDGSVKKRNNGVMKKNKWTTVFSLPDGTYKSSLILILKRMYCNYRAIE